MWLRVKEAVSNNMTMNVCCIRSIRDVFFLFYPLGKPSAASVNYEGSGTVHDAMHLTFTMRIQGEMLFSV